MKLEHYKIIIGDNIFNLPKDMPVPRKGSVVYIENQIAIVDHANYYIQNRKLYTIHIHAISKY